ncbi:MAG: phage major capsid protein [Clostridia bacterium]|nr:phage major capsid protein [Clostridia bacterium]
MAIIDRTGAEVLIPEEKSREILQSVPESSIAMRLMRRLPNMSSKTRSIPVLGSLPMAYFVDGDTGFKKTTSMAWENVRLYAEEIACIVPIPENVLDDSEYDIWANVKPRIDEGIGAAWDKAVFFGENKPANFPAGIVNGAIAAGNYLLHVNGASLYQELLGENGLAALIEEDGYVPSAYVGAIKMRSMLRGAVDNNGLPIFGRAAYRDGVQGKGSYELDGAEAMFPKSEIMDPEEVLLLGGEWNQAVWAIRTDISTKLLTEAVIQDPSTKEIVYNLAQQDMVALRVTFRAGWALPNPINRVNPTAETRYPFAVLRPSSLTAIESAQYSVTAPAKNGTPQATHDGGTGYTAAIAWSPADGTFGASKVYTATVTLTAADGYAFANNFSAADIVGLPATTGDGHTAQTVNVVNNGDTVVITVKYVATGA